MLGLGLARAIQIRFVAPKIDDLRIFLITIYCVYMYISRYKIYVSICIREYVFAYIHTYLYTLYIIIFFCTWQRLSAMKHMIFDTAIDKYTKCIDWRAIIKELAKNAKSIKK